MNLRLHSKTALSSLVLALATIFAPATIAQPAATTEAHTAADNVKRPKICLVLSGGGARGAAHVGVLKVLEEYRVPIDCIAGTSMGALVGAAYATGTTLPEMNEIIAGISTELLFKEKPPREERSMRNKEDDKSILFGPELGVSSGGVSFGKGAVSGVQLETVLRQLTKAKGHHNFDKLPIPFRAVATDLVTGKAVVFREGELANVMRASMSVPGAVAPAEFGGMILVDGMLTSNLPVSSARAMGADVIIAVNVGTPLLKREQLTSVFGVAGQMLSILTEQNVEASIASLKPTDILISPDLGDFSTGDFDNLPRISPLGETAARKVAEQLARLSLPAGEYAALRKRQLVSVATDQRPVDEIRFESLRRVNAESAKTQFATQTGQPIDQKTLDKDMRRLYGTGNFEHVNYRYIEEPGRRILAVDAIEKSWGPDYLRFGLGLSSDFGGDAYFNILASYRKTLLNSLGAEWRTDLQFGRNTSLHSEFYQPLDIAGRFFVAPRVDLERRTIPLYSGEEKIAGYDLANNTISIDVGTAFGRYGELRLGFLTGKLKPEQDSGPPSLSPGTESIKQGAYTLRMVFDRLDSAIFPRAGWSAGMKVFGSNKSLGADDVYTKWDVDGAAVFSIDDHTFNFGAKAGGSIGSNPLPRYDHFLWGGFLAQSGYATGQLAAESLRFGRAMYYHRIMRGTLLEGAYGGISLEIGKLGKPLVPGNPEGILRSASVFVGADTFVGPAYLGYGRSQDGNSNFYFYLGRPF